MSENTTPKKKAPASPRRHDVLGNPILGGVLLMFCALLLYQMASSIGGDGSALSFVCGIVCCILMMALHRWWFRPELKNLISFSFIRDKKLLAVIALFFVAVLIAWTSGVIRLGIAAPTLMTLLEAIWAGFCEEVAFRALPLSTMMRSYKNTGRYMTALLLPAILFGLVHFINLYGGGDVPFTFVQVVNAAVGGIFYAAVFLRTGSLVPSFLIHALYDFIAFMQLSPAGETRATLGELIEDGFLDVAEIVLVVVLLRGQKDNIVALWQNLWGGAEKKEPEQAAE